MDAWKRRLCVLFFVFSLFQIAYSAKEVHNIERLDRTIDLNKNFVTEKVVIKLGKGKWDTLELIFSLQQYECLAQVQVEDSSNHILPVKEQQETEVLFRKFVVVLGSTPEDTLKVTSLYMNCLKPKPRVIPKDGDQYLYYESYVRFYCPYEVKEQKTTINFPHSQFHFIEQEKIPQLSFNGNKAILGPYKKVPSMDSMTFGVRFRHNTPLLTGSQVANTLKVSHWGWLQVLESYDLENKGAESKGGFSRLDFQSNSHYYKPVVEDVVARLPTEARDVSYKDYVGNITSSHLRGPDRSKGRILQLKFRYPLIGGWKNAFFIGYRVPSKKYLKSLGSNQYQLRVNIPPSIRSIVIEKYVLRVALPEGAKNIAWDYSVPFAFDNVNNETMFDLLDIQGRPLLVFEKRNMVPTGMNWGSLVITYELKIWNLLEKLLLPVVFILILLAGLSLASRLSLYLRDDTEASNSVCLNNLYSLHCALSDTYKEAIHNFSIMKGSVITEQFSTSYNSIHARLKELELQLELLNKKIASLGNVKLITRANQLTEIDKTKHEILQRWYSTTRSKLSNLSSLEKEIGQY
ncbi:oligosaccharyltransferase complex subunit alpha (ribophorin I) [Galdieria sulphuraria]|uniref:Dolichyl-diphosphooligosaccharide--protein glycosyltransferase subunit 1 n=1 Tax=Galdieria sulphuraria TaxID=130081 RepID=M2VUB7_GALSU|nr:oligosaccharyltransferase complex subunit alpha (ribophorin I) [Galdieria sulphuraria]EME26781.1 oligosaccharyltransferase complex subunit alpha (ribophorin I) [Galdieria sulphuraria]|eukprot:XP_005703301.1 oligosaccharyltransferase complex subunit alpha (ribophorin I) [Galdieria sulphuraria]